jgi:hypothetical protein
MNLKKLNSSEDLWTGKQVNLPPELGHIGEI